MTWPSPASCRQGGRERVRNLFTGRELMRTRQLADGDFRDGCSVPQVGRSRASDNQPWAGVSGPVIHQSGYSSPAVSIARGRSRSIPGRGPLPPTVISRNGLVAAEGVRCLIASSSVAAMESLTLTPLVAASRRTRAASRSTSRIVVRIHAQLSVWTSHHQ